LAGKFSNPRKFPESQQYRNIAILVPCYKEDQVILPVARQLIGLDYPQSHFDVVIIADGLKKETLEALSHLPVMIIHADFAKSTKTKSLNLALNSLTGDYDIAIINDADNIPHVDFLKNINNAYDAGHRVIQTQRVAKNLNTPFALLDAASEIINNHLFRKGANALGLSASIIGSGMAYPYQLLKDELSNVEAVGGFDKVLQLRVIEKGIKILYLEGTLIFDEKIEFAEGFRNQRKRWLSSQFIYWKRFFIKGFTMLLNGNVDYFNLAVVYNLFPPRIILASLLFLFSVIFTAMHFPDLLQAGKWWALFFIYIASLSIALPAKFYDARFFIALLKLPYAALQVILILFKLRGADQKFIHTPHTRENVENTFYTTDAK
jgi:cellulose synthase/poly-beta-1,6-N-acetylglucosamine synthase-like glycosyltransferase